MAGDRSFTAISGDQCGDLNAGPAATTRLGTDPGALAAKTRHVPVTGGGQVSHLAVTGWDSVDLGE